MAALNQEWVAEYNGPGGDDKAKAMAVDNAGNIYVTGTSGNSALHYFATVKYDSTGAQLWEDTMEGEANDIAVDSSGNVYVTGNSYRIPGGEDYTTIKYSPSGTRLWVAYYDGTGSGEDKANAVAVDDLGNVYVTGKSDRDYGTHHTNQLATVKYDNSGTLLWADHYSETSTTDSYGRAIAVDSWGNVYVTGSDTIKYDVDGLKRWIQHRACDVMVIDSDSKLYCTDTEYSSSTSYDVLTYSREKTLGSLLWESRWNSPTDESDGSADIVLDDSGNVHVAVATFKKGQSYDCLTIKYDNSGTELWVSRYNNPHNRRDEAFAIALDNSGNVYITGRSRDFGTEYDYLTIQYDDAGNELDVIRYNGPDSDDDTAVDIAVDHFGNVYVTGQITRSGQLDYATIKYSTTSPPAPVGGKLILVFLLLISSIHLVFEP
jgi:hypothetical protein